MIKLILIGNLTKDPEKRSVETQNGPSDVTSFTIAVNGRREGETSFFRISVWGRQADTCAQYLLKGRKVCCVCNEIRARTYQAQDGTSRISMEATANEVEFLSPSRHEDGIDAPGSTYTTTAAPASAPAPKQQEMTPVFNDDEMPF